MPAISSSPRLAFIHDWLTGMRGGEKCLELLCQQYPQAKLFTLLHRMGSVSPAIEHLQPQTSLLNWLPQVHRYYRLLLPVMPMMARWRIRDVDLVLSLSHCIAKSAKAPKGVPHLCYCFSPMRYAWHMKDAYFANRKKSLKTKTAQAMLNWLREWDLETASRVTHFIAISKTIQDRIRDCYGRESSIVFPPMDTEFYTPSVQPREDFYLVVSAMAPYKRIDLAIEACQRLNKRLILIGTGQDAKRLQAISGPECTWLGWQSNEVIRDHLRRCRALLFPGEEDFGIVPAEANACGTPVIAYGRGGATETLTPQTGIFFPEQTVEALLAAMETCERTHMDFDPQIARQVALQFRAENFVDGIQQEMNRLLQR